MGIGTKSRIKVFEDFMGFTSTTQGDARSPQAKVQYGSVNGGSFAHITDEPGGVLTMTTDTDGGDNVVIYSGPFKPSDGGVVMETRLKISDATYGYYYVGFQETLAYDTPVVAATADTAATLTHGATGCHAGFFYTGTATADTMDWVVIAGDGAVAASNSTANGTATGRIPADSVYEVFRVEIDTHGNADFWVGGERGLEHIKHIEDAVTATDQQYALAMAAAPDTQAAIVAYVDYFLAEGNVDWTQ